MLIGLIISIYNYCSYGINHYDKYLNRDISSIILRNNNVPFYCSNKLYSSHYIRTSIIDIPNNTNNKNNTNIDIKK